MSDQKAIIKKRASDLRDARTYNAVEFEETIYKYFTYTGTELREAFENPKTTARDLVVIQILSKAIEYGDNARLNFLLERTIGKVADRITFNAKVESYQKLQMEVKSMTYEELEHKYLELVKS